MANKMFTGSDAEYTVPEDKDEMSISIRTIDEMRLIKALFKRTDDVDNFFKPEGYVELVLRREKKQ